MKVLHVGMNYFHHKSEEITLFIKNKASYDCVILYKINDEINTACL